jgi:cell division protein FtsB
MLEFRKKKIVRKVLYSPITLIFLSIIFIFVLKGSWGLYNKEKFSRESLEKQKSELEKLIDREKSLASSIEYLKTDQGIENEIRSKFRAVKEGEKVSVIVDEEASTVMKVSTTTKNGFWYSIFHW